MNKVLLTGRLTRDPEMRSLSSGKAVTQFSIATNEYIGQGKEKAEFHCKGKVYRSALSVIPLCHLDERPTKARRRRRLPRSTRRTHRESDQESRPSTTY